MSQTTMIPSAAMNAGVEPVHWLVAVGPQRLAELAGDVAELPAAEGHLGQLGHRLGRLAEGGLAGGGADDLAEHRGAVVMRRQPQARPLREKNPGGKPGSGTWARRRRPRRPRSRSSAARVGRRRCYGERNRMQRIRKEFVKRGRARVGGVIVVHRTR